MPKQARALGIPGICPTLPDRRAPLPAGCHLHVDACSQLDRSDRIVFEAESEVDMGCFNREP